MFSLRCGYFFRPGKKVRNTVASVDELITDLKQ